MAEDDATASGIHDHEEFKLGKKDYVEDERTLKLEESVGEVATPPSWDFDAERTPFRSHMWGNDKYGDCTIAGRANQELRLQRVQTRKTPGITDQMVIDTYKMMTGCVTPGDDKDTGLYMIDTLRAWRKGWALKFGSITKLYKIEVFGYVRPANLQLVKTCAYLFSGIQFGVNLPLTAQRQMENGEPWDVVQGVTDGRDRPGSWGGHAIYGKKFDPESISVLTWGKEVKMTNAFFLKYCEEAWAVIDHVNDWAQVSTKILDVQKLLGQLKSVGVDITN